jgi:hypothetical protein
MVQQPLTWVGSTIFTLHPHNNGTTAPQVRGTKLKKKSFGGPKLEKIIKFGVKF